MQPFPVAGDDEQGVVDPDAEPDHHAQQDRAVRDGEELAQQQGRADAGADTAEGHGDREAHGDDGAEGDDQHQHGEGEADQLGLRRVDHAEVLAPRQDH